MKNRHILIIASILILMITLIGCSPEKQLKLIKIILTYYKNGKELLQRDVPLQELMSIEEAAEIVRIKSEIPNNETEKIDHFSLKLEQALRRLENKILL